MMKENIIKTRNNMIDKLFNWLHSDMEFRVREEYDGEYIHYYPQVKGGILGKLGIWRYFTPLHYECNRYSIWAKTELMRSVPVEKWDRELAEKDIEKFIEVVREDPRVSTVG